MHINNNLWIKKNHNNELWHNLNGVKQVETDEPLRSYVLRIYQLAKRGKDFSNTLNTYYNVRSKTIISSSSDNDPAKLKAIDDMKKSISDRLIKFFSEFEFEPNFRFVNTLSIKAHQSYEQATIYVKNYFNLSGNGYLAAIEDKMVSMEWKQIIIDMNSLPTCARINNRLKLYYGSQGTGKTTLASEEAKGKVVVCHSGMLPADLMKEFNFEEGKPSFKRTALRIAAQEGEIIVLDEVNLLPLDSLRFLQSILDGKSSFVYGDETINIADGFCIIGTMNLFVNGQQYGLPEPLIDRAFDIREFKLTAEQLSKAF